MASVGCQDLQAREVVNSDKRAPISGEQQATAQLSLDV
jgi:hypothetical protein